jgi:DNA-binding ferritin-like protein
VHNDPGMCDALELTVEMSDSRTERMLKGFIEQLKKNNWMLTAFTK